MDINSIPAQYCINAGCDYENRIVSAQIFDALGLRSIERFPAINPNVLKRTHNALDKVAYAEAVAHRIIVGTAQRKRHPSVLILRDTLEFNPGFNELIAGINLPDDWGMFVFGCRHKTKPEVVAPNLVRCTTPYNISGYVLNWRSYSQFLEGIRRAEQHLADAPPHKSPGVDHIISKLAGSMPIYAPWPNAAWEYCDPADKHAAFALYDANGMQQNFMDAIADIPAEIAKLQN